jgi:hypothetical protein
MWNVQGHGYNRTLFDILQTSIWILEFLTKLVVQDNKKVIFRLDTYEILFGIPNDEQDTIISQFNYMFLMARFILSLWYHNMCLVSLLLWSDRRFQFWSHSLSIFQKVFKNWSQNVPMLHKHILSCFNIHTLSHIDAHFTNMWICIQ